MSGGQVCQCEERAKPVADRRWTVYKYKHNNSAFSGYHYTPSDYSSVGCRGCRCCWRTKADYVEQLDLGDLE